MAMPVPGEDFSLNRPSAQLRWRATGIRSWRAAPGTDREHAVSPSLTLHRIGNRFKIAACPDSAVAIVSTSVICAPPRFAERRLVADIGLHALARRYQRSTGWDDGAVLRDLLPLANAWGAVIAEGGDFAIPAAGGGRWIGSATLVRDAPVLAVRTYIERE
jgi:hypothetical protein